MKNLYCSILSSGLVGAKRNDPYGYRISIFLVVSLMGAINLVTIDGILTYCGIWKSWNFIQVDVFKHVRNIHAGIYYTLNYMILPMIMNYFLIYYKDNYKKLMKNYPQKSGKLFVFYGIASMVLLVRSGIIGKL